MSLNRKHYRYSWRYRCWMQYLPHIDMWFMVVNEK